MKNSTIKDLFYEKVGTVNSIKISKAYLKIANKSRKVERAILANSNKNVAKLLNKYFDLQAELESEAIDYYYVEGFKIGVRIAFECANKK